MDEKEGQEKQEKIGDFLDILKTKLNVPANTQSLREIDPGMRLVMCCVLGNHEALFKALQVVAGRVDSLEGAVSDMYALIDEINEKLDPILRLIGQSNLVSSGETPFDRED